LDGIALHSDPNLLSILNELAYEVGAECVPKLLVDIIPILEMFPDKPDIVHSRLEFLQDRAGKTRVVALADVFTQTAMKPIFDHFTFLLKRIPQDVSFDEAAGLRYARSHISLNTKV